LEKEEKNKIFISLYVPGILLVILWMIQLYQYFSGVNLGFLGVMPRKVSGLIGIFTAPLIHGDFNHIISNSIPLYFTCVIMIYSYRHLAYKVFAIVYIGSGLLVWIFARQNIHIGASGVVYGIVGFLFLSGIIRRNINLLGVTFLITFLYGSLFWGILPFDLKVSWESHLFGALTGFVCALLFINQGPPPPADPFEGEEDEDDENNFPPQKPLDDPIINYIYKEKDVN
jgi:membrane associated rhomboid family serine protease